MIFKQNFCVFLVFSGGEVGGQAVRPSMQHTDPGWPAWQNAGATRRGRLSAMLSGLGSIASKAPEKKRARVQEGARADVEAERVQDFEAECAPSIQDCVTRRSGCGC